LYAPEQRKARAVQRLDRHDPVLLSGAHLTHQSYQAGDKECREPVYNTQVVGTIQYIEWLILNDRVQPSFSAGV
jgi:hypothetical protein